MKFAAGTKPHQRGCRDGLAVKSTDHYSREPMFISQRSHESTSVQSSVTLGPGDPVPSSDLLRCHMRGIQIDI